MAGTPDSSAMPSRAILWTSFLFSASTSASTTAGPDAMATLADGMSQSRLLRRTTTLDGAAWHVEGSTEGYTRANTFLLYDCG